MESMLDIDGLAGLIDALKRDGYDVLGPTVRDGAIVHDHLSGIEDLPQGWRDEQAPGHYRLHPQPSDPRLFDHTVGPHSWKRFLHPATESQVRVIRSPDGALRFESSAPTPTPTALIGVRACELAAIQIQDRVFLAGPYVDPIYRRRRTQNLVIAVNCTQAAPTCFCTSMETGPEDHG